MHIGRNTLAFVPQNLLLYIHERFSLSQFIPLALLFGAHASLFAQALSQRQYNLIATAFTILALLLFLFRLRLFDEFKDYEHDKRYYPKRPVSRGLISLRSLQPLIALVIFAEVIISLVFGLVSFLFYLAALLYSLLLLKEFFLKQWLRKHFTLYILLHEVLAIFLFYYLYAINTNNPSFLSSAIVMTHALFLTISFFSLEVARKIRPQSLEIASKDTYTAQYGIVGANMLLGCLQIISYLLSFFILAAIDRFSLLSYSVIFVTLVFSFISLLQFSLSPNSKNAKRVFSSTVIYTIILHAGIISTLW